VGEDQFFTAIIRDVTNNKAAEARLLRQTKLYAALSQCNKAIVHCTSEQELFPKVCRAAVLFGDMKMAWIGMIDDDSLMVRPVASFGDDVSYIKDIAISVDVKSEFGHGPIGTAIRDNQPCWCQDFLEDPLTAPWHEHGAHAGLAALAALPLRRQGRVVGAFSLYADVVNAFDDLAQDLLVEMANDISFALDNFTREAQRRQAEERLFAAEEKFRGLVEQAIAGIFIIQDGKLAYVNPRGAEIIGCGATCGPIGDENPLLWVAVADREMVSRTMRQLMEDGAPSVTFEFGVLRPDGTTVHVGANAARATHDGRPAIIGMLKDISAQKRADAEIRRYLGQLKTALKSTVEVATIISEMRDPYTAGHERRVAEIAAAIGAELGLDEDRQEGLRVAGHLHDLGKMTVPSEILSKPGKLRTAEYMLIQEHAQASYDVLKGVEFPWPVALVALQHHERIDGTGYPQGLKNDAILFEARIMAVADVVEAMSSHRPYRPGLGIEKALAEIKRGRGTAYDADVADACLRMFQEKRYQLPT
jgi:PAS domain S-box-containing protein